MTDLEDSARVVRWVVRTLGKALALIGVLMLIGAGAALLLDSLVWLGIGAGLGLVFAGVVLRDTDAVREITSGRPS